MAYFDTLQATTEMIQVGIERSQAESIAKTIAKVQGETLTKDFLDLRIKETEIKIEQLRGEMKDGFHDIKQELQFTKWTNKAIFVCLGVIASALIKIAFFH